MCDHSGCVELAPQGVVGRRLYAHPEVEGGQQQSESVREEYVLSMSALNLCYASKTDDSLVYEWDRVFVWNAFESNLKRREDLGPQMVVGPVYLSFRRAGASG